MSVVSSSIWKWTSSSSSVAPRSRATLAVGLDEQVEVRPQAGQRGAQLVPGVGDQLPLPVLRRRQGGEHRVERAGQPGDLVVPSIVDGVELLGARDLLGGVGQPTTGRRPLRATAQPARAAPITPTAPKMKQDQAQLVQGALVGLHRLGDNERDPVGAGRHRATR